MPMQRDLYPLNWRTIATEIKAICDWTCQECSKQCRRPGESFRGHTHTLTVAHAWPENHAPDAPVVCVMALCAPCHLRFDVERKLKQRKVEMKAIMTIVVIIATLLTVPAPAYAQPHGGTIPPDAVSCEPCQAERVWLPLVARDGFVTVEGQEGGDAHQ